MKEYKNIDAIKKMLSGMHKPWMDEDDKEAFDKLMIEMHGDEMDKIVESMTAKSEKNSESN